jgi:NAD(P)-dependent dehydrogenase (short-subunit alcohol dehydrogenase family)
MTMPVEYAAIKSAIIHLTKYLVKFLKNKNIRVNALSPGGIIDNQNTQFLQQYKKNCSNKGMLEKEDLSGSLLFLLSDMSKQINGQNLIVDDGFVL